MLRTIDAAVLDELGLDYATHTDGPFTAIVIRGYRLPVGLQPEAVDMLIRLPPGFPDAAPDMFWTMPKVLTSAGTVIPGTEAQEMYLDQTWQRWSRHIGGQWRPGIDNLGTYLAYIRRCLDQAAGRAA